MIDAHCHIDLFPNPTKIADQADRAGVLTITVTNLPSAFDKAQPHVKQFKRLRHALGLHPLLAAQHATERRRFRELVDETSYIGEVGLDFGREGISTKETQIESFRFVLQTLRGKSKFVTLHSRRAESAVLDILEEEKRSPVVFHWFSGPLNALQRALDQGHYFSFNPAMTLSPNGHKIIERVPPGRVLTETDAPFVKVGGRTATPPDVVIVENYLASVWNTGAASVRSRIRENFLTLIEPLRTS